MSFEALSASVLSLQEFARSAIDVSHLFADYELHVVPVYLDRPEEREPLASLIAHRMLPPPSVRPQRFTNIDVVTEVQAC
ncbi:hypothetical protein ACFU0W_09480 [Microbacterium keratanolyticum]|uniref:hypothetical protein n=1 Tax=Microbacterium keratanolyticum TaxID=67574 RepID=UPI003643C356